MKVLSIIGARPQFIKEAILQKEISKYTNVKEILVHTGQHYDENMSGVFFETLDMKKPDYNLGITSDRHGEMTGRMLIQLEQILIDEVPELVILYGDTNSTLAGALAASKLKLPIAHVEAGLRQDPKDMPEEINRVLTDRISKYLFAPSKLSMDNLRKEGLEDKAYFVGDVMYDIFLKMKDKFNYSLIEKHNLKIGEYIVMTLHRDFNVDEPNKLKKILQSVNKLSKYNEIIFPIHPRTKKKIDKYDLNYLLNSVKVIEPIDYLELMGLTQYCKYVITDSGGFQKEAYFSNKKAFVIMPDTGWRELTVSNMNILCDEENLYDKIINSENIAFIENIYGYGDASQRICKILFS